MPLTPKQKRILEFVASYQKRKGYAPSQVEIASHFGFKSLGTVQNYLVRLEREGYLTKAWNGKRAIALVSAEKREAAQEAVNGPSHASMSVATTTTTAAATLSSSPLSLLSLARQAAVGTAGLRVPLLGQVAAGRPLEAIENREELDLTQLLFPEGLENNNQPAEHYFALKVRGDSMINAGILEGDCVIVRSSPSARSGEIVVATIDNEATLKTYHEYADRVELHASNPAYPPIVIRRADAKAQGFRIEGVMTTVLRSVR